MGIESSDTVDDGLAAFNAAFSETTEGSRPEAVIERQAEDASREAAAENEPNPAPQGPADLAEQIKVLQQRQQKLDEELAARDHQLRSAHGRLGALQREHDKLARQAQAKPAPAEIAPTPELDQFDEELPGFAKAVTQAAQAVLAKQKPEVKAPEAVGDPEQNDAIDTEERQLNEAYPEWAEKVASTDFDLFLTSQGDAYRNRVKTTDSAVQLMAAIAKFDAYTAAQQHQVTPADQASIANQQRAARAAQAVQPNTAGTRGRRAETTGQSAFYDGFKGVAGS